MSQTQTKLSLPRFSYKTQNELRTVVEDLSLRQKLAALKASEVLAQLQPSETRTAVEIIRQRNEHMQLDFTWLASFLRVLEALKAEENQHKLV